MIASVEAPVDPRLECGFEPRSGYEDFQELSPHKEKQVKLTVMPTGEKTGFGR